MTNSRMFQIFAAIVVAVSAGISTARAATTERRIALVIGNANYSARPLVTPANDAGLVAQTLQAAGFDVVGARDVDSDTLRHTLRDFVDKAASAGPDTVAFVYIAGYGLQYEGENYLVPVDARIDRDIDVPVQAVRLSDYLRPLNNMSLKYRMVVIDAARDNPFAKSGNPLASGLALIDPEPGLLIAFNAAPGTIAPEGAGPYGSYAQGLAEMIREGGLSPSEVFNRLRQRVADVSKGAFIPWNASREEASFLFFERAAEAPPPVVTRRELEARRAKAMRDFEVEDAFHEALDRDTMEGYLDFLDAYPHHPLAKRVRAIVAARREAITWRLTYREDTPPAYWSYLDRYPHGPHSWDARRRLRELSAELEVPREFVRIEYDLPPPPPDEIVFIDRPVVLFGDPYFDFAPPPPPSVYFVPPPPPEFVVLEPPAVVVDAFVLPVPVFVPVARWCDPPRYVAPPPQNIIFNNIHNTVVVNNTTVSNTTVNTTTEPALPNTTYQPAANAFAPGAPAAAPARPGFTAGQAGAAVVGAGLVAASLKVALPPAVAKKQALVQTQGTSGQALVPAASPLLAPDGKAIPQLPAKPTVAAPLARSPANPAAAAATLPASGPPVSGTGPNGRQGQSPNGLPAVNSVPALQPKAKALTTTTAPLSSPSGSAAAGPSPSPDSKPASSALSPPGEPKGQALKHFKNTPPSGNNGSAAKPAFLPPLGANKQVESLSKPGDQPALGAVPAIKSGSPLGQAKSPAAGPSLPKGVAQPDHSNAEQAEQLRLRSQAAEEAALKAKEAAAAQDRQRRLNQAAAQEAERKAQKQAAQKEQLQAQQRAAQEAQRRAQQQQAAQDAQRQAQQRASQEAQRRAEQQAAHEAQQQAQQRAAQEAQRRAQQQQAAQEAQRRAAQAANRKSNAPAEPKKCGQPGLPACPPG
jgi:uncharacterized caspase-like protein